MNVYGPYMNDVVTNGISVATYDMMNNGELVGISSAKDFFYYSPEFEQKIMHSFNFASA